MSAISDRYRRRIEQFRTKIMAVSGDSWSRPSPCSEWTAVDVVDHVVETSKHFLGMIGRSADVPSTREHPLNAFDVATGAVLTALDDPVAADTFVQSGMGDDTFENLADRFLAFDLVVHAWDLARAANIDDTLDLTDVSEVHAQAEQMGEVARSMGAFGPVVDVRDDADAQSRMLAAVGRKR